MSESLYIAGWHKARPYDATQNSAFSEGHELGAGDNNRTNWTRREHEEEIALITGERACIRVFWPPYESYGRALDVKKNSRKTEVG
jgi:hypothetical protein